MIKLIFESEEHKVAYLNFIKKAKIKNDKERKSLFYLLALMEDTRKQINDIYDFKDNSINIKSVNSAWQTGGTTALTKLAFNLYNGFKGEEEIDRFINPLDLFSALDRKYFKYLFNAIEIRFGILDI